MVFIQQNNTLKISQKIINGPAEYAEWNAFITALETAVKIQQLERVYVPYTTYIYTDCLEIFKTVWETHTNVEYEFYADQIKKLIQKTGAITIKIKSKLALNLEADKLAKKAREKNFHSNPNLGFDCRATPNCQFLASGKFKSLLTQLSQCRIGFID